MLNPLRPVRPPAIRVLRSLHSARPLSCSRGKNARPSPAFLRAHHIHQHQTMSDHFTHHAPASLDSRTTPDPAASAPIPERSAAGPGASARPRTELETRTSGGEHAASASSADEATLNGDEEGRVHDGQGGLTEKRALDLEKNVPGEDPPEPEPEPRVLVSRSWGLGAEAGAGVGGWRREGADCMRVILRCFVVGCRLRMGRRCLWLIGRGRMTLLVR